MTEQNIKKEVKKIGTKALLGTLAATSAMNPMVLEGLISEAYASDEIDLSQDYTDTVDGVVYTWTASTKTLDIEGNGASVDNESIANELKRINNNIINYNGNSDIKNISINNISILTPDNINYIYFGMFEGLNLITLNNVDTSSVTNMSSMFSCNSLKKINGIENIDTSSVTDMSDMFYDCESLTELDVSNFDTSSVTNMSNMFYSCNSLEELDVSNFDTSSVTNMSGMFKIYNYSYDAHTILNNIDVSNFDTSSVTDMSNMFYGCESLTELDVSNFDTSQVTNMLNMFCGCELLTELDVSNFDTSSVTNMSGMFDTCSSLTELDVHNFDTSQVTDMSNMFNSCSSLTELDVHNFDTSSVTNMSYMFSACLLLTELDVSNFDTSQVTDMSGMFFGCDYLYDTNTLNSINVSNFDTSQVTNMSDMFYGCNSLEELNLSNFDTSSVTNMSGMFEGCSLLTEINGLENFNTSSVTDMRNMFEGCSLLTEINGLENFNTSSVTDMRNMFMGCKSLKELDLSSFTFRNQKDTGEVDVRYMIGDYVDIIHLPVNGVYQPESWKENYPYMYKDMSYFYNEMGISGDWYDKNNYNDLTAYQFSSDADNHLTSADCGKTIQRGRDYKVNYYVNNTLKDTKSGNFRIGATPSGLADNLSFDKSAYVVDETAYNSESEWGFRHESHFDYDKDQLVTVGAASQPCYNDLFEISEDPAENIINVYLRSDKVTATFLDKDGNTLKTSTIDYRQVLNDDKNNFPTDEEIKQRVEYTTTAPDETITKHLFNGWEIKDNVNNETFHTPLTSDITVVPTYRNWDISVWNVTVNFVDTEGNEIAPSKTGKVKSESAESSTLNIDMPEINGYEFKSTNWSGVSPEDCEVIDDKLHLKYQDKGDAPIIVYPLAPSGNSTINVVYKAVKPYNLIVNFQDENGNKLKDSISLTASGTDDNYNFKSELTALIPNYDEHSRDSIGQQLAAANKPDGYEYSTGYVETEVPYGETKVYTITYKEISYTSQMTYKYLMEKPDGSLVEIYPSVTVTGLQKDRKGYMSRVCRSYLNNSIVYDSSNPKFYEDYLPDDVKPRAFTVNTSAGENGVDEDGNYFYSWDFDKNAYDGLGNAYKATIVAKYSSEPKDNEYFWNTMYTFNRTEVSEMVYDTATATQSQTMTFIYKPTEHDFNMFLYTYVNKKSLTGSSKGQWQQVGFKDTLLKNTSIDFSNSQEIVLKDILPAKYSDLTMNSFSMNVGVVATVRDATDGISITNQTPNGFTLNIDVVKKEEAEKLYKERYDTLEDSRKQYLEYINAENNLTATISLKAYIPTSKATVTINYLDEEGNKIADSLVKPVEYYADDKKSDLGFGNTYRISTPSSIAKEYTKKSGPSQFTLEDILNSGKDELTINLVYAKKEQAKDFNFNFKLNYVDSETGKDLRDNNIVTKKVNGVNLASSKFSFTAPEIEGYRILNPTVTGSYAPNVLNEITFNYKKIPVVKKDNIFIYRINYVDRDGNKLLPEETINEASKDETFVKEISAKSIEGYTPVNNSLTVKCLANDIVDVTFVYDKNAEPTPEPTPTPEPEKKIYNFTYNIKYVDSNNNELLTSKTLFDAGEVNSLTKTFEAEAIEGYTPVYNDLTATCEGDNSVSVVFVYNKDEEPTPEPEQPEPEQPTPEKKINTFRFKISYIDKSGNKIDLDEEIEEESTEAVIKKVLEAKQIDGYISLDDVQIAECAADEEILVEFKYDKKAEPENTVVEEDNSPVLVRESTEVKRTHKNIFIAAMLGLGSLLLALLMYLLAKLMARRYKVVVPSQELNKESEVIGRGFIKKDKDLKMFAINISDDIAGKIVDPDMTIVTTRKFVEKHDGENIIIRVLNKEFIKTVNKNDITFVIDLRA